MAAVAPLRLYLACLLVSHNKFYFNIYCFSRKAEKSTAHLAAVSGPWPSARPSHSPRLRPSSCRAAGKDKDADDDDAENRKQVKPTAAAKLKTKAMPNRKCFSRQAGVAGAVVFLFCWYKRHCQHCRHYVPWQIGVNLHPYHTPPSARGMCVSLLSYAAHNDCRFVARLLPAAAPAPAPGLRVSSRRQPHGTYYFHLPATPPAANAT